MPCWMLLMTAISALRCSRFFQQPLRLVEEARVLERDAHGVGESLQQTDIRLAERMLALHVIQDNQPQSAIVCDERDVNRRFRMQRIREVSRLR